MIQQIGKISVDEVRERQQALEKLEGDITDIHKIYKDLSRIVHSNDEIVDHIEANVGHTVVFVEETHTHVNQAVSYQRRARRTKILLCSSTVIALLLIGILIFIFCVKT
ncbi:SNARE domain-containing protein [Ditylenchus destructor]|nr:SNARE domain-containing protein [Ditylenchus destructor]